MMTVKGLRWSPERGYEIRQDDDSTGNPVTDAIAKTAPYTLGGERLDHTARRFPWTWCAVHPSTTWRVRLQARLGEV